MRMRFRKNLTHTHTKNIVMRSLCENPQKKIENKYLPNRLFSTEIHVIGMSNRKRKISSGN